MEKATILIVDDEETMLFLVSEVLKRKGYDVLTANGVSSGLELFKSHRNKIDLVMIDIRLGKESGFDLADALEKDFKFHRHVFLTAFFWEEKTLEQLLARGKPYFEKPLKFDTEVLPFLRKYFHKEQT
jgi:two-component system response regulator PilR (NtrC family)